MDKSFLATFGVILLVLIGALAFVLIRGLSSGPMTVADYVEEYGGSASRYIEIMDTDCDGLDAYFTVVNAMEGGQLKVGYLTAISDRATAIRC